MENFQVRLEQRSVRENFPVGKGVVKPRVTRLFAVRGVRDPLLPSINVQVV